MQTYQKMKDSGSVWLGLIPYDWELKRIGQLFKQRNEKVSDKNYEPLSVTKKGVVPQLDDAAKTNDGDNRKKVLAGDFVINSRSDRRGSSGQSDLDGSVSLINTVLAEGKLHPRFTHHLLRSYPFQEEFYRWGQGIVADLWSTNYQRMKPIQIPVPDEETQIRISNFLDEETAKIDNLIAKQERLLELLEEKRVSIITQCTLKGLDLTVKYSDSAANWTDSIPAHWSTAPIKHTSAICGGGTPSKDRLDFWGGNIPWVSPKDMKSERIRLTQDYITDLGVEYSSVKVIKPGALLVVVRSGILQHKIPVAINDIEVTLNQDLKALHFKKELNVDYVRYLILGSQKSLLRLWTKQGATVESVEIDYLQNTHIPVPPIKEQNEIADFLNKTLVKYDNLKNKTSHQITLLKERRTSLISHAVTGKIRV